MPELPELTIFADNLDKKITGKKIVKASYHRGKKMNVAPEEFGALLESAQIDKVRRVGKQICFDLSTGNKMCVHLMLNGGFQLTSAKEVDKVSHPVLTVSFEDGTAMAVTDPKAWVMVEFNPKPAAEVPDGLGVTAHYLEEMFKKQPKMMIKPFLIDQGLIGGIGNAYSDEILWRARISPKSLVGKLPPEAVKALLEAIPAVLKEAIAELRKRRPDAVSGEIREFLKVHGAGRRVSPTGARIVKEQIKTKTTYYTDEQVLYQ